MERITTWIVGVAVCGVLLLPAHRALGAEPNALEQRLECLRSPVLDDEGYPVSRLVWQGDQLTATFEGGVAVPVRDCEGLLLGYVYAGDGTLQYEPPDEVERHQLERKTGHAALDGPFHDALLLAADGDTLAHFGPLHEEPPVDTPARARTTFQARWHQVDDPRWGYGPNLEVARLVHERDAPDAPGFVFAEFGFPGLRPYSEGLMVPPFGWVSYLSDPDGALGEGRRTVLFGHERTPDRHRLELWTRHTPVDPARPIDMVAVDMDLTIPPGGLQDLSTIHNSVALTFTATGAPTQTAVLDLVQKLYHPVKGRDVSFEVAKVTDFTGADVPFVHHRGKLVVALRTPLRPGETETLTVHYQGDALFPLDADSYWVLNTWPWYPMNGFGDRATFAATVHYPADLRMAGTGTVVAVDVQDRVRTERWEEPVPVHFPSMTIGNYTTVEEATTPNGTTVRAFFTPSESQHADEAVGQALRVIQYYEDLFGPFPYDEVDIAEMVENMGFWQAPPGLILITKFAFTVQWTDNPERYRIHFASAILSHELAHQYWGHVVGWSAAEDQWFSEALAEYSSHLYTSHYYGADDYEARLKGWRRFARENAEYGPVAIHGGRLGDGRYGLWYCKGPYALHVLRHWIGDEAFIELLRTTCEAAPHRNVSTDDLRQLWEKRLGQDLGWFFDAWLHNPVLPDLEVRFTGGTPEDGMPRVTLTQVQDGPPVRLRVPLKLTVRKGAKGTATEWRTVSFDTAEYTAPLEDLPGALIDVEVDPQQTTLWARDPRPAREED